MGLAQTYSPWFNEMGQKWDNYDVEKCLKYNQGLIDDIMVAGWKMIFFDYIWTRIGQILREFM